MAKILMLTETDSMPVKVLTESDDIISLIKQEVDTWELGVEYDIYSPEEDIYLITEKDNVDFTFGGVFSVMETIR